jgi:D-alanyl-D-alanine carboxypeptidase/D-alanyl-D-alanine-endopeptidase (penicillin-binding protein 4)
MTKVTPLSGWASVFALLVPACHASSNAAAGSDAQPTAAETASIAPPTPPASVASPSSSAPARESTVTRVVPALHEAVVALSRKIAEYGGDLGVAVIDVASGDFMAVHADRAPLNPASNAKLFTAAAALSLLHGNYRFETALYGEQTGNTVTHLVLRGHGDPSLTTADLWQMVQELKAKGIQRVDGDIQIDQRFFDEDFVPPAFEQQPNEWASFRAPVSAVALDENTVTMTVRPGAAGAQAIVSFDPPGLVEVDGTVTTAPAGQPENIKLELAPNGYRLSAKIAGSIGQKDAPIAFTRRVDNPALVAGYALKSLLAHAGILGALDVKPGSDPSQKHLLALHRSAPLAVMLEELGKASDNFYAEMVFKTLGAEQKGRPAKSSSGADAVTRYLKDLGVWDEGTVIRNGSGLFDANRVTAAETARLLRAAYTDSKIAPEYVAQLAVGGVDGTLHRRFRELKDKRNLRAKTGTLESVAALSGYVLAPPGRSPIAFSIFVNRVPGHVGDARAAVDKCVDELVRYVWRDEVARK